MNRTNIEWCDVSWNPVTGCRRGCSYCYARRIHERFSDTPFSDIVVHPDRMDEPSSIMNPLTIFVGSMSDIEYWPVKAITEIIKICRFNPQHTFMFLSKNPFSYRGFRWPKNTMQGLTVQTNLAKHGDDISSMAFYPRPFLSIEPLLGEVFYHNSYPIMEKIIVGAMTGPGAIHPKPEWIESVKERIPENKLFWKENIRRML